MTRADYPEPAFVLRENLAAFVTRHYRAGLRVNAFLMDAIERDD